LPYTGIKGAQQVLVESFYGDVVIGQFLAVVQSTADYHTALPAAANAGGFIGVTLDANTAAGESVPVVLMGTAWVQAAGAIVAGDPLVIANATGQVGVASAVTAPNVIGIALSTATTAGDIVLMQIGAEAPLVASSMLKKLPGLAANATIDTQTAYPHGLPYTPTTVLVTAKGNGIVWESQAVDATNVYFSATVASLAFDAYVG